MSDPTPTEAGFLEAIRAAPVDDGPRLVYADWLEECGDPARAEFIRIQCEGMRRREEGWTPAMDALNHREHELLYAHRERWLAPLLRLGIEGAHFGFNRGVVEHTQIDARSFVTHAAALFAAAPVLRSVYIARPNAPIAELGRCPQLARVETLNLTGLGPSVADLARWPRLPRLRTLFVEANGLGDGGTARLGTGPVLETVEVLGLAANTIGPAGARALARSRHYGRVRELLITNNPLGDAGAAALMHFGAFAHVGRLSLQATGIGDAAVQSLASCRHLSQLEELDFSVTAVSAAGLAALADAPQLAGVRSLDLTRVPIGDDGVRVLCRPGVLPGLRELWLAETGVTDEGVRVLATSGRLAGLEVLDLAFNPHVTDAGAEALAASPHADRLQEIDLVMTEALDPGVLALARSPRLPHLWNVRQVWGEHGYGDDPEEVARAWRERDVEQPYARSRLHNYEVT